MQFLYTCLVTKNGSEGCRPSWLPGLEAAVYISKNAETTSVLRFKSLVYWKLKNTQKSNNYFTHKRAEVVYKNADKGEKGKLGAPNTFCTRFFPVWKHTTHSALGLRSQFFFSILLKTLVLSSHIKKREKFKDHSLKNFNFLLVWFNVHYLVKELIIFLINIC